MRGKFVKWHCLRVLRGYLDAHPEGQVMQDWFMLANNSKPFDFMFHSVFIELRLPSLPAKFEMQFSSCASPSHYRSSTRLQSAGWVILVLVPQTSQKRSQHPLPSWFHSCLWRMVPCASWMIQCRGSDIDFRRHDSWVQAQIGNMKGCTHPSAVKALVLGGELRKHGEVLESVNTIYC